MARLKDGLKDMLQTVDTNTKSMLDILNDTQKYINSDGNYIDYVQKGSVDSMSGGQSKSKQLPSWLLDSIPSSVVKDFMPGTEGVNTTKKSSSRSTFAVPSSMIPTATADNDSVLSHAMTEIESDLNKLDMILGGLKGF